MHDNDQANNDHPANEHFFPDIESFEDFLRDMSEGPGLIPMPEPMTDLEWEQFTDEKGVIDLRALFNHATANLQGMPGHESGLDLAAVMAEFSRITNRDAAAAAIGAMVTSMTMYGTIYMAKRQLEKRLEALEKKAWR